MSNSGAWKGETWKSVGLCAVLAASVAINVRQYDRTGRLIQKLEAVERARPLEAGEQLPTMDGLDTQGKPVAIVPARADRRRIVYWTSATCPWSARNEAQFRHLWRTQQSRFDIVVVAADREHVATLAGRAQAPYLIVGPPARETQDRARLSATPTTLVVDEHGKVIRTWRGAYFGDVRRQVEAFFGITLPVADPGTSDGQRR